MKKIIWILPLVSFILNGCLSSKKMETYVDNYYKNFNYENSSNTWYEITFKEKEFNNKTHFADASIIYEKFIPAVLFWEWGSRIICNINPKVSEKYFRDSFEKFSAVRNLKEKLGNKKLVITVKNSPNKFIYQREGRAVFLIVENGATDMKSIEPSNENFIISYKITENGKIIKQNSFNKLNKKQKIVNSWKSSKGLTEEYLENYEIIQKKAYFNIFRQIEAEINSIYPKKTVSFDNTNKLN